MPDIHKKLLIYKQDIATKGLYWSIVHRLYKITLLKYLLSPIVNFLKPDYLIIQGFKLYLDKHDSVLSQELILSGKWEEFETKIFKNNIKEGDVVVDLGAHIGYYTLIASKLVGDKGKVYSFEPDIKNFRILTKNVINNDCKNVVLINKAVSDVTGTDKLYLDPLNTGDHRIYDSKDGRKFTKIDKTTLDKFFNGEINVNLIKIDIQGSEAKALLGARKLIKTNDKLKIITEYQPELLELNKSSGKEYLNLLVSMNFEIFNIDEQNKHLKKNSVKQIIDKYPSLPYISTNLLCIKS